MAAQIEFLPQLTVRDLKIGLRKAFEDKEEAPRRAIIEEVFVVPMADAARRHLGPSRGPIRSRMKLVWRDEPYLCDDPDMAAIVAIADRYRSIAPLLIDELLQQGLIEARDHNWFVLTNTGLNFVRLRARSV